jgi:hypothetical protein
MSDITEFGFEDSKLIKSQGIEQFKMNRPGEIARVSLVAFKKFTDVICANKAREKGGALTDEEKAAIITKVDAKLAEKAGREITEIDRLDIMSARLAFAFTHFDQRVGTVRCLSKYEGPNVIKPEVCCNEFGDADQTIATIVMVYPTLKDGTIDLEDFARRKRVEFQLLRMSQKKFARINSVYNDARAAKMPIIDLKLTLDDGDIKFQKYIIENGLTAVWAREETDPELRNWVLEQGMKSWKYVETSLGFKMTKDKMMEKLRGGASGGSSELSSGEASAEKPQLAANYSSLLD